METNLRIISLDLQVIGEENHEFNFQKAIQIGEQNTIDELKYLISQNYDIEIESIWKGLTELRDGTIFECGLNNGDTVVVFEKLHRVSSVSLYNISSLTQESNMTFSNLESVKMFKERTVKGIAPNKSVDSLALFCNLETNDNNVYDQRVTLLEDNKLMRDYEDICKSTLIYIWISDLDDQIKLESKLHDGSFSKVFKTVDGALAIKKYVSTEQTYKQIWRELFAYERLGNNPRIMHLNSYHKDDSYFYMVMEYMKGGSLREYVRENVSVSIDLIGKWAKQILEGLVYLHSERVIHCDLKTSCILLDGNKDIKISGFDMAKYMQGQTLEALCGGIFTSKPGAYNYMAPEIIIKKLASLKSDIWSFGAILVELVTGQEPFPGMVSSSVCKQISEFKRIPFVFPEETSSDLQNLINICLRENYQDRENAGNLLEHNFFSVLC